MMAWVYVLECKDGSYYTGSTPDLERRVAEHQAGEGGRYTALRLPVRLVFSHEVSRIEDAFYLERQLKGWRREKKEALIRGDYASLVELSKPNRKKVGKSGPRILRLAQDGGIEAKPSGSPP